MGGRGSKSSSKPTGPAKTTAVSAASGPAEGAGGFASKQEALAAVEAVNAHAEAQMAAAGNAALRDSWLAVVDRTQSLVRVTKRYVRQNKPIPNLKDAIKSVRDKVSTADRAAGGALDKVLSIMEAG